ncbi:hypothetical protein TW65_92828 [Stemphylium lycopersici]|uniref:Uncharacterized protein n=1 Tax=Stemphylium lycopersici TaxID=183478 RepID=A0A364N7J4_STELY|nr:hypothetical protein TW65_92828 [Stemphylium lycopersici]RAR13207.1 hypothetical protein DDE83_003463 [Stemphylium lycopersici]
MNFWKDVVPYHPNADALVDAECAQSVWGSGEGSGPAVESSLSPTNSISSLPGPPTAEQRYHTEPDEEEFGDFVGGSTDLFKRPIYNASEDVDETLELLNTRFTPEWQTGFFVGVGLVEPVRARLDTSTRNLRKAGKLVLRRLNMEREKDIPDTKDTESNEDTDNSLSPAKHGVFEPNQVFAGLDMYEYVESARPATPDRPLNGVMRPVSFSRPESEELQWMGAMDGITAEERRIRD